MSGTTFRGPRDGTRLAFSFILFALLADGLDGIIARKTGKGELGEYFEAMGDMTSMGIALPLFVYSLYQPQFSNQLFLYLLILCIFLFYVICTVIRLAAFHPLKNQSAFIGLPASAGTIILATLSFININFYLICLLFILISILMISPVHFPKSSGKINLIATVLIIFTIILGNSFFSIAPILLCGATGCYSVFGPLILLRKKL